MDQARIDPSQVFLTGNVLETVCQWGVARQTIQAIERQNETINGHLKIAEQYSANINELSKLVATQASRVDFLIRRMAG